VSRLLRLPVIGRRTPAEPAAESPGTDSPETEPLAADHEHTKSSANEAPSAEPPPTKSRSAGSRAAQPPEAEPAAPSARLDAARLAAAGFSPVEVQVGVDAPQLHPDPAMAGNQAAEVPLSVVEDALARLVAFDGVVLSWVADDGYPMNVDVAVEVSPRQGLVRFDTPPGFQIAAGADVAITGTHIRALPEGGFDERSHVTIWGTAIARPRGRFVVHPERAWIRDETETPLPIAYERSLPKARRYFEELSRLRGYRVRPRMDMRLLLFRATRAPFLSATLVPVFLGLAVAAQMRYFDLLTAVLTIAAACAVHLGLNVANDVFDTLAGADDANATPTRFSGGSRVIQNALVSVGQMSMLAAACYVLAGVIGLALLDLRGSTALIAIAAVGLVISLAYTMPPLKLVYRGFGEVATLIGFGPVMLLGAYVVQSRGSLSLAAAIVSLPVGLLVAMILYVNEIPDRAGDARAGKRTLPVRLPKAQVILGFDLAVGAAFLVIIGGAATGLLPLSVLLALLAVPLAREVHRGLVAFYDHPYALMPSMGLNIQLHLTVGLLLLFGYFLAIADQQLLSLRPFLW
jgi:1,4-dihydroxy-2-naphthoate polyprenyltransferase